MTPKFKFSFMLSLCAAFSFWTYQLSAQSTQPVISISDTAGCVPLKVKLSTSAVGVMSYYWDFGTGTSTLANPTGLYVKPGKYTVKVVVKYKNGISDSTILPNVIRVAESPKAAFNISSKAICPGEPVSFTNTSAYADYYAWDFGDGITSTVKSPQHKYSKPGKYTVKLLAYNNYGCRTVEEKKDAVFVDSRPNPKFTVNNKLSCDSNFSFSFFHYDKNTVSWLWNFGDGTSSVLRNPSHTYSKTGIFTVSLTATNATGCKDSFIAKNFITIDKPQEPDFTVNSPDACVYSVVRFKSTTANAVKWLWDFGDGQTSTQENPEHAYSKSGSFTVKLTTYNANGCNKTTTKTNLINVHGGLNASFKGNGNGCSPLTVSFVNTSVNSSSWLWEFGDGTTSTEKHPAHTFTKGGRFTVTLHAYSKGGCEKVISKTGIVSVFDPATADFAAQMTEGCPPFKAVFVNKSGNGNKYFWNFGDGATSTDKEPTHVYQKEGRYSVSLVVENAGGCRDTIRKKNYLTLKSPQTKFNKSKGITACVPYTTNFTDATPGNVAWEWDFGDGTKSTSQSPMHTYNDPGTYSVTLTTINTGGCRITIKDFQVLTLKKTKANFVYTTTTCPPYTVNFTDSSDDAISWFWDFGDGATSQDKNPKHIYDSSSTYSIRLTTISKYGCSNTVTKSIKYNTFGANPEAIPQSVTSTKVDFKANSQAATSWYWDFGDGKSSTQENPTHNYSKRDESLFASLTISNGNCTRTYKKPVFSLLASNGNNVLGTKADFFTSILGGCAPLSVQFRNTSLNAVGYEWDFGDGVISRETHPQHVFKKPGDYKVKLTAFGSFGYKSYNTIVIRVTQITAGFSVKQIITQDSAYFLFSNTSTGATSFIWDFGDGTTSTDENPTHTYPGSGSIYRVKLEVADSFGCSNNAFKAVLDATQIPFRFNKKEACAGDSIAFTTSLKLFKNYAWDFGDSTTSDLREPAHLYKKGGNYIPSLTVTDDEGSSFNFRAKDSIMVSDPRASFKISSKTGTCDSVIATFENLSSSAGKWVWNFGDGTTSEEKNPIHKFNKAGTYTVSLTATGGNCSSTYNMTSAIKVLAATPDFDYVQQSACLPITVSYKDKSTNAVQWVWDFGDGTLSTEQNPVHIFYTMPKGNVKLTIKNSIGCSGTATKPNISLIKAAFSVPKASGCAPFTVNFKDESLHARHWLWSFGDGSTSTEQNPVHTYVNEGQYTVKLVINFSQGCSDSIVQSKLIKVTTPHAAFISPQRSSCAPSLVAFLDKSENAVSWHWDFGDGVASDVQNPAHIYTRPGSYTIKLRIKNKNGCGDSLEEPNYISVLGPEPEFEASATEGCPPLFVNFKNKSKNAVSWLWNFGDGSTSSELNPAHIFENPGAYSVSMVTYDSIGCKSVFTLADTIKVYDRNAPGVAPIQRVSVENNTAVDIEWQRSLAGDFKSYILYRLDPQSNQYRKIAVIDDRDRLFYKDDNLDTRRNTYTYKLQTEDICGNALALDSCVAHTTINVEAKSIGEQIAVTWTPYQGCVVGSYAIYREEPGGAAVRIAEVNGTTLNYTDTTLFCPLNYSYRIMAKGLGGTMLVSLSDTSITAPQNKLLNQKVDVVKATVINNESVLIEWKEPAVAPEKVTGYSIYRSGDRKNYYLVGSVPKETREYYDKTADIQHTSYDYRVEADNACNMHTNSGSHGSSILLTAQHDDDNNIDLKWNGYEGWPSGPAYYIIERLNDDGQWEVVKKVDGKTTQYKDTK